MYTPLVPAQPSHSYRWWWLLGCLNAALAVALGALASHAIKEVLTRNQTLHWFELAQQYQMWHALGLLVVGMLAKSMPAQKMVHAAGALMLLGMLLFCGLLYLRSVGVSAAWHGFIPVGGACFIAAWLVLMLAVWRGAGD